MLLAIFVVSAIFYLVLRKWLLVLWTRGTGEFPQGPWPLPFVGDALKIDSQEPYRTFEAWAKRYGSLYSVMVGSTLAIVISDLDLLKKAFKDDRFSGRPTTYWDFIWMKIGLPKGPAESEGAVWKEHRKFSMQALKDFGFGRAGGEARIQKEAMDLVQTLLDSGGKPFENRQIFATAAASVIVGMLFGEKIHSRSARFMEYIDAVSINFQQDALASLMDIFPWLRFIPPFSGNFHWNLSRVREQVKVLKELVLAHKLQFDPNNPRDYIDAYLKAQAEGRPSFTDEQLLSNITDLFGASIETTATFLRWGMALMIAFPKVQQKVHEEIDKKIGRSRTAAFADRANLPYVEATIVEIFRFASFGPFLLPHKTVEAVEFGGYNIPKDATVFGLSWWILRNPALWKEPRDFRPERFLDSFGNIDPATVALVPMYSIGKRSCPGEPLARMETLIFFVSILQYFTISGEGEELSLEPVNGLTLTPPPYKMRAVPRK